MTRRTIVRDALCVVSLLGIVCLGPSRVHAVTTFTEVDLPGYTITGLTPGPGGLLYGVTAVPGTLYSFDPATSVVTTVHDFGGAQAFGELFFDPGLPPDTGTLYGTTDFTASSPGTVFSYANGVVTTLRSDFNGYREPLLLDAKVVDPPDPLDPLDESGEYLYGTLVVGGAVFRMKPDGSGFKIIHAFSGSAFGMKPWELTLGADGFLYGVTERGGASCGSPPFQQVECGTIFRLRPLLPEDDPVIPGDNTKKQFQILHSFQSTTAGQNFPTRKLVYGSDGFLYGGAANSLFRFNPIAKSIEYIFGQGGRVIEGSDGRLYVNVYEGGPEGAGSVVSMNKDGTGLTVLHDFSYTAGHSLPSGRLYRNAVGTIFGTTEATLASSSDSGIFVIAGTGGGNRIPIAIATAPATVGVGASCLASVVLDGTGSSDPDGDLLTYSWTEGAMEIATGSTPTVQLGPGSHTITLTVRDPAGLTGTDTVTVVVTGDATLTYQSPALLQGGVNNTVSARLADAGGPIAAASVIFTVSGVPYAATTDAAGIATASIPIPAGAASAVVRVDYAGGACGGATTTVTVPVNRVPVASGTASAPNVSDQTCSAPVTLDASASLDLDGDTLTYLWTEGATTLSTLKTPTVTLAAGGHSITLTVDDGRGGSASTIVTAQVLGQAVTLEYLGPGQLTVDVLNRVSARLRTVGGAAVAGVGVRFEINGVGIFGVTDATGVAVANVTPSILGPGSLVVTSISDACTQSTSIATPVTVVAPATTLVVIKTVINDNGGNAAPADFVMSVSGVDVALTSFPGNAAGTTVALSAGPYSVTETNLPGYDATLGADCTGTISIGETRTCTIVNNDRQATLQLTKSVINNNGGAAAATAWTLTANGTTFATGVAQPVAPGSYVLAESGGPAGYTPGPWGCTGGTLVGNTVTIPATATVTCGITNDDQPAQLTLTKIVVNDNGGGASAANWLLAAGALPFVSGASRSIDAGTYTLTESGGPAGYAASAWSCTGGVLAGASLTLALGEQATCSITNDDMVATLTVIKNVINNDGGTRQAAEFTMRVTGGSPSPASFPGSELGTAVVIAAGAYNVTEAGPTGYGASFSAGCAGTIAVGESRTCIVTNDDRPPSPPVADATFVSTPEDVAVNVTLTGSDADGDSLTFTVSSQPQFGTLTGAGQNLTYTPDANYFGPDTFTFKVNDGTLDSNVATVTITVTPVNDPPIATPQVVVTPEDVARAMTLSGTDIDGGPLTYAVVIPPANGVLSGAGANLVYTPNANYNGPDTFTFTAFDGLAVSAPASIDITVTPVNDQPTAASQALTTPEDVVASIVLSGSDIDGDALGYAIVAGPSNGVLTGGPPNVTYTPNPNYFGPDSFTFTVTDGQLVSTLATVSLTVTPANDAPIANDDATGTALRTAVTITALANDSDVDGNPLAVTAAGPASNGTVVRNANGSITYTPRNKFAGIDTFGYAISDGQGGTATATVRVTVGASANSPPRANRDTATTTMSTPIVIAVLANDLDPDGDTLSLDAVTPPASGAAVANADGTVTYTPAAGFRGQDRFTYRISDGRGGTAIGDVRVRVQ